MLDRQGDDIEDQGLAFDLGTVLTRRRFLGALGLGAGSLALAACAPTGSSSTTTAGAGATTTGTPVTASAVVPGEMHTETAGPYPGDGSNGPDVLDLSGVERSDLTTSIDGGDAVVGVPLTLTMNVIDMANGNAPYAGAAVYVWHCDGQGRYSMYSDGVTEQTWLRGVQIADANGQVTFTTIVPGCYAGRWPHIHFEVFPDVDSIADATNNVLTSQIAIPEEMSQVVYATEGYEGSAENLARITLATDNVFSDGWEGQLPSVTGDAASGYRLSIDVAIDTTTEQEMSALPPGGGAGGPAGPGGPGGEGGPGGPAGPGGMPPARP